MNKNLSSFRRLQYLWVFLLLIGCSRISNWLLDNEFNPEMVRVIKGRIVGVRSDSPQENSKYLEIMIVTPEKEFFTVVVGPSWYLHRLNMYFRSDEEITVIGSIVDLRNGIVIAKEIHRGRMRFVLRDNIGQPRWDE